MKTCPGLDHLALFAGGDIDPAAMADIEAHAAGCAECRKRIVELQEDCELLRTPPAIPETAYMQVRSGVLNELERRQRRRYLWVAAAAAAILFACLLPLSIRRTAPRLPPAASVAVSPRLQPLQQRQLNVATKARVPVKKKPLSARPALPPDNAKLFEALDALLETKEERRQAFSGSVMVELKTEDPNVTIILLEESTGGAE